MNEADFCRLVSTVIDDVVPGIVEREVRQQLHAELARLSREWTSSLIRDELYHIIRKTVKSHVAVDVNYVP